MQSVVLARHSLQSEATQRSFSLDWLEGAGSEEEDVSSTGLASLGPVGIAAANPSKLMNAITYIFMSFFTMRKISETSTIKICNQLR